MSKQIADMAEPEHFEVLIVGAGISGIAAAYHLRRDAPQRSFVILDAEDSFGGTWRTNRFPGIRSDSDLYTFGYGFKPWSGPPIATGAEILSYLGEAVEENDLRRHMRFGHRAVDARWSSQAGLWTVTAETADGGVRVFTGRFLFMCQGYFRHREGHMPDWPGQADFGGRLVHAQEWPDDLDLAGKKVVVVGSGATAATIVPNIAETCAETTLLQRSPTYFAYADNSNELADRLRALKIDEAWIHEIVRRDILAQEAALADSCRETPDEVRSRAAGGGRSHRRAGDHPGALLAELPALASAPGFPAERGHAAGDPRGARRRGHRRDRAFHARGGAVEIRSGTGRGRRDRRHRFQHERLR